MENMHLAAAGAYQPENAHPPVPAAHQHDATHRHAAGIGRGTAVRRFLLHYLEMVVAMVVGMVALAPVWSVAGDLLGWSAVLARHDVGSMVMAANMTLAMGAWMRFRRHGWRPVAEMGAAMFLPFAVLLVPLWLGAISHGTLMLAGHLLMLVGMAVAMLLHPAEYTQHQHA